MTLYEQIYHAINGKKSINRITFKNHIFYISIYLESIVKSNKIYCFSVTHKISNDWEEIQEGRYKKNRFRSRYSKNQKINYSDNFGKQLSPQINRIIACTLCASYDRIVLQFRNTGVTI